MPGKKNQRGSFISDAKLLREVTEVDTGPNAVAEFINAASVTEAQHNTLHVAVIVPSSIESYTIALYSDPVDSMPTRSPIEITNKALVKDGTTAEARWALVDGLTDRIGSSFITVEAFYPAKKVKVLIEDVVGDFSGGSVFILYGISD